MTYRLEHGDCLSVLRTLPDCSLDSLVTDPPAGIAFMGKAWDRDKGGRAEWVAWLTEVMRECLRVLKPGAHGLVWALPRTSHWTATALEDAGFEVRDVITHLFGTGFPKSLDVSKAIDAKELLGSSTKQSVRRLNQGENYTPHESVGTPGAGKVGMFEYSMPSNGDAARAAAKAIEPQTDAARQWQGWGTALKPAAEFWWLVRKPLAAKTVAANVLEYGTGAINVDGCRVGTAKRHPGNYVDGVTGGRTTGLYGATDRADFDANQGRFPANVVLSHSPGCDEACAPDCAVRMLDEQSGNLKGPGNTRDAFGTAIYGSSVKTRAQIGVNNYPGEQGGASRFFYCAKASRSDRNRKAGDGQ